MIYNDGLHLYAYCSSNPGMYSDPSGFAKKPCKSKVGGECGSESGTGSVDIELKYKDGWTAAQKAEADAKVKALSDATTVKTPANRGGTSASSRYKSAYGKSSVPSGYDVDHTIDLQLGGADDILNMNPLDMSVNRSLGVQIKNSIKDYPDGTVFGQFTIK